jgi:hypothetical protein
MVASPSSPNDFVGRERELQQITEFVDANHPRHGKPRATNLVILLYGTPPYPSGSAPLFTTAAAAAAAAVGGLPGGG